MEEVKQAEAKKNKKSLVNDQMGLDGNPNILIIDEASERKEASSEAVSESEHELSYEGDEEAGHPSERLGTLASNKDKTKSSASNRSVATPANKILEDKEIFTIEDFITN